MKDCGCGGKGKTPFTAKGFGKGAASKTMQVTTKKSKKTTRVTVGKNK